MGKTSFKKCEEFIKKNFKKKEKIGYIKLSELIMREIGSDPRTISNSIRTMLDTKLIKDIGKSHFKILYGK